MKDYIRVEHTFKPIYDKNSKILILGSLPSVKSRENNFYYGHPQNRFWRVIASIYSEAVPATIEEKTSLLLKNNIAIWDVIKSCDIIGSSDSSIKNVIVNDLSLILNSSRVNAIYANGKATAKLYNKYCEALLNLPVIELPSTSPANATYSLDKLIKVWNKAIIEIQKN